LSRGGADFEVRTADWLTWREAQAEILGGATHVGTEFLPAANCLGRALAEDIRSRATLPPWVNSAMDGYAVRAEDVATAGPSTPVRLSVTGIVHAGEPPGGPVGPGEAVRVMTGAPVPEGADSVVRVEDTDAEADVGTVQIVRSRDSGRHLRPAGQDMRVGDVVLRAGQVVTPTRVGLLAALGVEKAAVFQQPTIGVLSTGNELRTPDQYDDVISGAGVPESNGPMLVAAVLHAGGRPMPLGIARDDVASLEEAIDSASDADALITIGGASLGEADLVKRVLDGLGFEQAFWRVKMRPGSPFGFGWLQHGAKRQAVFSLPGNPTSAFVTYELFVRPFVLALAGHSKVLRRTIRCEAAEELRGPGDLAHFLRVRLDGSRGILRASLTGVQGSGLMRPLAEADGLAIVPQSTTQISAGDPVDVVVLSDAPGAETFGSPHGVSDSG
jgi:molybdopterin molybdotransferase